MLRIRKSRHPYGAPFFSMENWFVKRDSAASAYNNSIMRIASLALWMLSAGLFAQTTRLELGKPVPGELTSGRLQQYTIAADVGQFLRVVVSRPGFATAVRLTDPDGKASVVELHWPRASQQREPLCWIARVSGTYRIEFATTEQLAVPFKYEIALEELRLAVPDDQKQLAAQQLFEDARALDEKGQYRQSIAAWDRALYATRELKNRERESAALSGAAMACVNSNQYEKAIGYYEPLLAIRREMKDVYGERVALNNLGNAHSSLRQYDKAIGYAQQLLAIAREIKDRSFERSALNAIGVSYNSLAQYDKAIGYHEQALAIAHELKDRSGERVSFNNLGFVYQTLGQYEKAIGYYEQALAIAREIKDRIGERLALNNLGIAFENLVQYQKAVGYYVEALALNREIKDRAGEYVSLNNIGGAYYNLSHWEKAASYYEQALSISRGNKDRSAEGRDLFDVGLAVHHMSQSEKAISYYEQSLTIKREIKDRRGEGSCLNNLGLAYSDLSQYEKAIGYYEQALAIMRETKDRRSEAGTLNNLGLVNGRLSQYEKAIGYYEQALAIKRETKDRRDEASTLYNLGNVYGSLSQYDKAISHYEQALVISRETKDRHGEGLGLGSLGSAYESLDQHEKAVGYHEQALAIVRETNDRRGEGYTLNNLGGAYDSVSQYEKAIAYHKQALAISYEIKDHNIEGQAFHNLGRLYGKLNQYDNAIGYYERALAIRREAKHRRGEASDLSELMKAWSESGKPRLAIFYGKQAVNTTQSIRSDMLGLGQDLQRSFLKGNEKPYHTLAELLIAQGRLAEAEQVLALLKEEEYFQYIRRDAGEASSLSRRADLTSDEAEWEKRYREIGDHLMAIGSRRGELLAKKAPLGAAETLQLEQLDNDISVGNRKFEQFLGDLAQHFSAKVDVGRRIEELRETQGIMEDLRELPVGTVAIYTLVGEDTFHAILRTPDAQKAFEYPIKGSDLNRKVLEFREAVRDPKLDPRPLAQELYKILVAGMAEDLRQAKAQTLMWSLDGALRYVPLAALYDGKQYMIEQYRMSVMTLASNARLMARPDNRWKAAGFGVTKAYEGAAALPSVSQELVGIIATKPGERGVLSGEIRLDGQFTLPTMRQTLLKHYPVVHIASHFRFQPGNDANSFLLLGDGAHLSLAELRTSANMFGGVQLLTLSACNTGVGDGSEVEGFGALAQRQGAKAVIASLWPVADESTSLLMQKFYRIRESAPRATKLEALRQAQLALLRGTVRDSQGALAGRALIVVSADDKATVQTTKFSIDPRAPYAHPYYWAPFFLMGNWL